jgi:GTP pyrophosphokinase
MEEEYFNHNEKSQLIPLCVSLMRSTRDITNSDDYKKVKSTIVDGIQKGHYQRDSYGINPLIHNLESAVALCERVSPDRSMVIAILLYNLCKSDHISSDELRKTWGEDITKLIQGLLKISTLYSKSPAVESDNFRKLLLTFAEDIRVIIIMIVDRLTLMRAINHHPDEKFVHSISYESNYLYAPLAHRLGLYSIKSELEDMSLKYTNRDIYTQIARKLNETKVKRDAYIADFIKPIKEKLQREGLKFDIKGRTKSISSIWNKIKKQKNDLEHIYDLFAIRIIIDTTHEREKSECWLAYSLITDMYQPNPARMKDWLTIPKSNGYESLHITVYGPQERWVEVQIRTKRMDEIAEKGLAAHWKYKGIKSESNLDTWMNNVRDILEAADSGPMELVKNFKLDIYNREVFVFTPKGDLYKLPLGATLLDFAFNIHSKLGCQCTGGKVNGKVEKLNYKLRSGDTVEVITSSTQQPKRDWLNFVVTSKARNKIRQTVHERENRAAELGKELLMRRFKNRKIEIDEGLIMKLIKKLSFKTVTDFYHAIATEVIDINSVIDHYELLAKKIAETNQETRSAEEFTLSPEPTDDKQSDDVLIIGNNIKGINYRLAKCCNPIYGDEVFGFVSAEGVIKIHRQDCPNALNIKQKYPYRLIRTEWSGKLGTQFGATLRIVGHDDIGIVTNITSIINKEKDIALRNISIDSNDGLFQGYIIVGVNDTRTLDNLIKKIKTVKGVKDVQRSK